MLKTYLKGKYGRMARGMNDVSLLDLRNNGLKNLNQVSAEGIPNAWGAALLFSWMLKENSPDTELQARIDHSKRLFIQYLKGYFCGLLEVEDVPFKDQSTLMKILKEMSPYNAQGTHHTRIVFFKYRGEIVAASFPDSIIFPASAFSFWPAEGPVLNNKERALLSLIDQHYEGVGGAVFENLFRQFLASMYAGNKHARRAEVAWVKAVKDYLAVPPTPDPNFNSLTCDGHSIEILMGMTGATPDIAQFALKQLNPFSGGVITYKNGVVNAGSQNFPMDQYGVVYDGSADRTYIFDMDRPSLLHGCFSWSYVPSGLSLSFRSSQVHVPGDRIVAPEKELLVEEIRCFKPRVGSQKKTDAQRNVIAPDFPDLPVKLKYLGLVEKCTKHSPGPGHVEYTLEFKGYGKVKKIYSDAQKNLVPLSPGEFQPNLALWPDFLAEDWKEYFAYYCSAGPDADQYAFSLLDNGGKRHDIGKNEVVRSEQGFVRAVFRDKDGGEYGIYDLSHGKKMSAASTLEGCVDVGIDLGTSNTCVAWRLPGGHREIKAFGLRNSCRFPFFNRDSYLPQYFFPYFPDDKPREIMPTELVLKGRPLDADEWRHGPVRFSIPFFGADVSEDDSQVVEDIKWRDDARDLKAFVCELLLLVFARIRSEGYSQVNMGFSYPNAFTNTRYRSYFGAIAEVLTWIAGKCGVTVNGIKTITESKAGAFIGDVSKKKLVVDMGGGTTDIALLDENGSPIFSDSMRYAGNDILNLINKKTKVSRRILTRVIRSGGFPDNHKAAESAILDAFEVVYDLIRRFIAAAHDPNFSLEKQLDVSNEKKKPGMEVYLIGQAWNFYRFASAHTAVQMMGKHVKGLKFQPIKDPKKVLAQNILLDADRFASLRDFADGLMQAKDHSAGGRMSIMGANFSLYVKKDGAGAKVPGIDWRTKIDLVLPDYDSESRLHVQLEEFSDLLLDNEDNTLCRKLAELEKSSEISVPRINAEITSEIGDPANDYIAAGRGTNRVALKVSPFILFIERIKTYILKNA